MAKSPFPKLGEESGPDAALIVAEPADGPSDLPGSSKEAAAKAFFSAGQENDWKTAASALEQFVNALDDEADVEPAEGEELPEAPPF